MSSHYILLSKKQGLTYSQYRGQAFRLSEKVPHTVDEVVVALKNCKTRANKITTFRDINGNIIERAFDFFDKDLKNKQYKKSINSINDKETVVSTGIRTYTLPRIIKHVYKEYQPQFQEIGKPSILWTLNSVETHFIATNTQNDAKIHSQTYMRHLETPRNVNCAFIEYPNTESEGKALKFKINMLNNKVSHIEAYDAKFPQNDKFIKFRAMDIETAKEWLCNYFIKENKLSKLKLKPNTNYNGDKKLIALYDDENGSININKNYEFKTKRGLVSTVRHEIEHAWQWFLHARNTGGNNPRAMELAKRFGKLRKGKLQEEADKCTRAISTYVPYSKDINAYRKNWVEKSANKAGAKAAIAYEKQGATLRKQFPHIPSELF